MPAPSPPPQNNLHELWALLNFLFPSIFDTSDPFDSSFDSKAGNVSVDSLDRLQRLLQGVMLRRLKAEVEKGLPPKKEVKLFLPVSPMQAEWYRHVLLRDLPSADGKAGKGAKRE
jgi:SNF2 family DNA or RNA helicase